MSKAPYKTWAEACRICLFTDWRPIETEGGWGIRPLTDEEKRYRTQEDALRTYDGRRP